MAARLTSQNLKRDYLYLMATFCTTCAERIGIFPEIDTEKILAKLKPGYMIRVCCEGCEMVALSKEEDGRLMRGVDDGEGYIRWVELLRDLV